MKKYLDILLFTLAFFLLFTFFTGQEGETQKEGIFFEVSDSSYKVPAGVSFLLENYTGEALSLNTCENIDLRYAGENIGLPEDVCRDITIANKEGYTLNLGPYYERFLEPGDYTATLNIGEKQHFSKFEVAYRGAIGKIFTGLFYAPVFNLLAFLADIFYNSLGMAIIGVTVIIRILLLFPQHKMMVSQRKMQAIQPKIKELQKKYKGNQQQMGMELMQLYKKEGVNPMGSCGFLLLQMPILIVMYHIVMNITLQKNEFYLYSGLKDFHISQIDFNFLGMDLLASGGVIGLGLALTVACIQFMQVKLSLMHKNKDTAKSGDVVLEKKQDSSEYSSFMPDPEIMNKFMLYGMPAMIAVFTFSLPAGIGLYWGVSTLFAIFQQVFVNKIIKK